MLFISLYGKFTHAPIRSYITSTSANITITLDRETISEIQTLMALIGIEIYSLIKLAPFEIMMSCIIMKNVFRDRSYQERLWVYFSGIIYFFSSPCSVCVHEYFAFCMFAGKSVFLIFELHRNWQKKLIFPFVKKRIFCLPTPQIFKEKPFSPPRNIKVLLWVC